MSINLSNISTQANNSKSQTGGAAFWVVVFLLIGSGLFFIPELIGLVKPKSNSVQLVQKVDGSDAQRSELKGDVIRSDSSEERARLSLPKSRTSKASHVRSSSSENQPLNWKTVSDRRNMGEIQVAAKMAGQIANSLPKSAVRSRYALANFKNGVNRVVSGRDRAMPVGDAVNYFALLKADVNTAFDREGITGEPAVAWRQISLGPVIDKAMNSPRPIFDPQIRLTWISAKREARRGAPDIYKPAKISATGYLIGADVGRLEIVSERGVPLKRVSISSKSTNGYRAFKIKASSDQPVILKATHIDGRVFYKKYRFDGRLDEFHFTGKEYFIPYPMQEFKSGVTPVKFDSRLDNHFAVGSSAVWKTGFFSRKGAVWTENLSGSDEGRLFSKF
mgnify:CR=1 FL=1